jgi:excisionase family DNA binding protein
MALVNSGLTMPENDYLSTREAASALGISLGTVQKMVESGVLEAWKTEGGHRRIPSSAIRERLAQRQGSKSPSTTLDVLVAEDALQIRPGKMGFPAQVASG